MMWEDVGTVVDGGRVEESKVEVILDEQTLGNFMIEDW